MSRRAWTVRVVVRSIFRGQFRGIGRTGDGWRSICVHCGLQLRSISDSSSFVLFMPGSIAGINFVAFVSSRAASPKLVHPARCGKMPLLSGKKLPRCLTYTETRGSCRLFEIPRKYRVTFRHIRILNTFHLVTKSLLCCRATELLYGHFIPIYLTPNLVVRSWLCWNWIIKQRGVSWILENHTSMQGQKISTDRCRYSFSYRLKCYSKLLSPILRLSISIAVLTPCTRRVFRSQWLEDPLS